MTTEPGQEPIPTPTAPEPPTPPAGTGTGTPAESPAPAPEPASGPADSPPWERDGQTFDPERAWTLIQNLRAEVANAKKSAPESAPAAPGTDPEVARQVATLSTELARERVARKHALPDDLVALLGDGDEKTLADRAAALIAWRDNTTSGPRRPVLKPRGGADPTTPAGDTDPASLAAQVVARRAF